MVASIPDPAGCSKWPSSKAAASEDRRRYPLGYVEDLNDARTMLADFFSSLPLTLQFPHCYGGSMSLPNWRIGRALGIPIHVHASWFVVFFFVTWSLAVGYLPET